MNVSMRRVSAIVCPLLICVGLFGQEPPENSPAGASQSSAAHQHQPTRCDLKTIGAVFERCGTRPGRHLDQSAAAEEP